MGSKSILLLPGMTVCIYVYPLCYSVTWSKLPLPSSPFTVHLLSSIFTGVLFPNSLRILAKSAYSRLYHTPLQARLEKLQ